VFERFTERARQVVVVAQEEARTLRHDYIGTEHILLGLLGEEDGLAAHVLQDLDVTLERVRGLVVRIVGSGQDVTSGQIPFTQRAKCVLDLAQREALTLGHDYIGTEHILLGLVSEDKGVATRILLDLGADSEKIRSGVIHLLAGPGGQDGRPANWTPPTARLVHHTYSPRPPLDWKRASLLWRPEGLELRIPLHLNEGAIAAFAADAVWAVSPLEGMRREIWDGWLALASPSLLDETDPVDLRQALDGAATRALDGSGREHRRVDDFLRRLRNDP